MKRIIASLLVITAVGLSWLTVARRCRDGLEYYRFRYDHGSIASPSRSSRLP